MSNIAECPGCGAVFDLYGRPPVQEIIAYECGRCRDQNNLAWRDESPARAREIAQGGQWIEGDGTLALRKDGDLVASFRQRFRATGRDRVGPMEDNNRPDRESYWELVKAGPALIGLYNPLDLLHAREEPPA